jgi:adenylate cyclase
MATEIERKFLVVNDDWRNQADAGEQYKQGYLVSSKQSSVRVRLEGEKAKLNIKSATLDIRRAEYEYDIPVSDANEMLDNLCDKPFIQKKRYHVKHADHMWEVDVFAGENDGLIVAEIELQDENEIFSKPDWAGEEVSDDPRYYNVSLVKHPYQDW